MACRSPRIQICWPPWNPWTWTGSSRQSFSRLWPCFWPPSTAPIKRHQEGHHDSGLRPSPFGRECPFGAFRPILPSLRYCRLGIELHCHSLHSDGTDTPEGLALSADEAQLMALCLTDHDSLGGIPAFLAMQFRVKVRLLVGTEISCRFLGRSLHVLGLLVNPSDIQFQTRLEELRGRREERNRRMVVRLAELGCPITREDVQAQADSPLDRK